MKAQTELLIFILMFLLSISMFVISVTWSRDVFQQNVGMTEVSLAEKFMKELDYNIKSIIEYGGYKDIDYNIDGPISLMDNKTLEVRVVVPSVVSVSKDWNTISSEKSYIREMLDGDVFRIQLNYPDSDYKIILFTDGPSLARPERLRIEKNSTYVDNDLTTIKIRITFI